MTYKSRKAISICKKDGRRRSSSTYPRQGQDHKAGKRHLHINWSNFKPEFSGKPEEDAEAHLLHSNDWMNAHHFDEDIKFKDSVLHY